MLPEKSEKNTPLDFDPTSQDPDDIMQRALPQVPESQVDAVNITILGRFAGKREEIKRLIFTKSKWSSIWKRIEQTQFVRVNRYGTEHMERYDPKIHGEWDGIPDIEGMTPEEFVNQLEGFGDEDIPQNQQFNNERKKHGGARKTQWPTNRNPKPKKITIDR